MPVHLLACFWEVGIYKFKGNCLGCGLHALEKHHLGEIFWPFEWRVQKIDLSTNTALHHHAVLQIPISVETFGLEPAM